MQDYGATHILTCPLKIKNLSGAKKRSNLHRKEQGITQVRKWVHLQRKVRKADTKTQDLYRKEQIVRRCENGLTGSEKGLTGSGKGLTGSGKGLTGSGKGRKADAKTKQPQQKDKESDAGGAKAETQKM